MKYAAIAAMLGIVALAPFSTAAQQPAAQQKAPAAPAPQPPTAQMLANVSITRDVIYGHKAGMALTYDVFKPRNANGTAVINMISGSWISTWQPPENRLRGYQGLLDKGITVIAMHHGSAPQFKVPDASADIRRGVRHVKLNARSYGIDPNRIGAFGRSAGGHLSLVAGMMADDGDRAATDPVLRQENHIKTVVAYYPPTNMSFFIRPAGAPARAAAPAAGPQQPPARAGAQAGRGGGTSSLDYDPALAPTISPVLFVDAKDPPVLIITGDADRTVNIRHSNVMKEAMDKAGVQNVLTIYPGADHGFRHADPATQAKYLRESEAAMIDWFVKRL